MDDINKLTEGLTKIDLVRSFIPNASPHSVSAWFRREVHSNATLMRALTQLGYRKTLRSLSPEMVALILQRNVQEND